MSTIRCRRCSLPIAFDANVKSASGKLIPLEPNKTEFHKCPEVSPAPQVARTEREILLSIEAHLTSIDAKLSPVRDYYEGK